MFLLQIAGEVCCYGQDPDSNVGWRRNRRLMRRFKSDGDNIPPPDEGLAGQLLGGSRGQKMRTAIHQRRGPRQKQDRSAKICRAHIASAMVIRQQLTFQWETGAGGLPLGAEAIWVGGPVGAEVGLAVTALPSGVAAAVAAAAAATAAAAVAAAAATSVAAVAAAATMQAAVAEAATAIM